MPSSISEDAMSDFILASDKNFHTALLTYTAFPYAAEKLISSFARRIEHTLADEPGWKVTCNSLASTPREHWVELKWAPVEWEEFGWGISLSPQNYHSAKFLFGLFGVTATNMDPDYLKNPKQYPAMPDADRAQLGNAVAPFLSSIGDPDKTSGWWARYTYLRTVGNWMEPSTLRKIAFANGLSEERDFIAGKPMDVFIVDIFRAVKKAIEGLPNFRDIRPTSS